MEGLLKLFCVVFTGISAMDILTGFIYLSTWMENVTLRKESSVLPLDVKKITAFGSGSALIGLMLSGILSFKYGICSDKLGLCTGALCVLILFGFFFYVESDYLEIIMSRMDKDEAGNGNQSIAAESNSYTQKTDKISGFAKMIRDKQVADILSRIADTAALISNISEKSADIDTKDMADSLSLACELAQAYADMETIAGGEKSLTEEERRNCELIQSTLLDIADTLDGLLKKVREQAADNFHKDLETKIQTLHEEPKKDNEPQEDGNSQPIQDPVTEIMRSIEGMAAKINSFAKHNPDISTCDADGYLKKAHELSSTYKDMRRSMDFLSEEEQEKDSQLIMKTLQEIWDVLDGIYARMRNEKAERVNADLREKVAVLGKNVMDKCGTEETGMLVPDSETDS